MSTPETVCPISANASAIALIPGPPTPITCTRRGCDRSSGAIGTVVAERADVARSEVDAAITTPPRLRRDPLGPGRCWPALLVSAARRNRLDQLGQRSSAMDLAELERRGRQRTELVGAIPQPGDHARQRPDLRLGDQDARALIRQPAGVRRLMVLG